MQKILKTWMSLGIAAVFCLGMTASVSALGGAQPVYAAEDGYYSPITARSGDELLGQVHDLITTTHTKYTSYDDVKKYIPQTDPALDGGAGIVEFYTHEPIREYTLNGSDAGRWNREHVWPQADSSLWGKEGGGSDLHHIRPTEVKMNSDRGNKKFGEVANGSEIYSQTTSSAKSQIGGYQNGGVFEPLDEVKGDAARIVMYLYVHYNKAENVHGSTNGSGQSSYFGTLHFTDIVSASNEEAAIEILLEWNELDPVDEIETTRNDVAFGIQGNRNPFIDHPEYADAIWGDEELPAPDQGGTTDPDQGGDTNPDQGGSTEDPDAGTTPPQNEPAKDPAKDNNDNSVWLIVGVAAGAVAVVAVAVALAIVIRRRKK